MSLDKKLKLALFLSALSSQCFANSGNTPWGKIDSFYYGSNGKYVEINMDTAIPTSFCGTSNHLNTYILHYDGTDEVTKD